MDSLDDLRNELNSIDEKIATLLEKRMQITDRVGAYKRAHSLPRTDAAREREVISNIRRNITHPVLYENIQDIYTSIYEQVKKSYILNNPQTIPFENITVIGLGMIGGSLVKAIKVRGKKCNIFTLKRDSNDNRMAIEQGYITAELDSIEEIVKISDLIVLATPINNITEISRKIIESSNSSKKTIIMDVASVKRGIGKTFEDISNDQYDFIPTHPMAGSDKSGFDFTKATLFVDNPWVITPHKKNAQNTIDKVTQLITAIGSKPVLSNPDEHDKLTAYSSHMVILISTFLFMFMHDKQPKAMEMSGTGFEIVTRSASLNSKMRSQIYESNKEHIDQAMTRFMDYVSSISRDVDTFSDLFNKSKRTRDEFIKKKHSI